MSGSSLICSDDSILLDFIATNSPKRHEIVNGSLDQDFDYDLASANIKKKLGKKPNMSTFALNETPRPCVALEETDTIQISRKSIFVLFESSTVHPISWDANNTDRSFIKSCIQQGCACIADSESVLLRELLEIDSDEYFKLQNAGENTPDGLLVNISTIGSDDQYFKKGKLYSYEDFADLVDGSYFIIIPQGNNDYMNNVSYNPLEHYVVEIAIKKLFIGDYLIKFDLLDLPKYDYFIISRDLKRLRWYSISQITENKLNLSKICSIITDPKDYPYQLQNYPEVTYSFVLKHQSGHLCLSAPTASTYNIWLTALKAIVAFWHGAHISHATLQSHIQVLDDPDLSNPPVSLSRLNRSLKMTDHEFFTKLHMDASKLQEIIVTLPPCKTENEELHDTCEQLFDIPKTLQIDYIPDNELERVVLSHLNNNMITAIDRITRRMENGDIIDQELLHSALIDLEMAGEICTRITLNVKPLVQTLSDIRNFVTQLFNPT